MPTRPGLGYQIDAAKVRRYQVQQRDLEYDQVAPSSGNFKKSRFARLLKLSSLYEGVEKSLVAGTLSSVVLGPYDGTLAGATDAARHSRTAGRHGE